MLIVYVAVQQIEGNLIIPLVMSRTTRLHPALIAIGVVVVGQLFGIVGLFVAVPIISAIVILTEEIWVQGDRGRARRAHGRTRSACPPRERSSGRATRRVAGTGGAAGQQLTALAARLQRDR